VVDQPCELCGILTSGAQRREDAGVQVAAAQRWQRVLDRLPGESCRKTTAPSSRKDSGAEQIVERRERFSRRRFKHDSSTREERPTQLAEIAGQPWQPRRPSQNGVAYGGRNAGRVAREHLGDEEGLPFVAA